MSAWSTNVAENEVMGPTVTRAESAKNTPPLKNGNDLRESGYLIAVGSRTARFRKRHRSKVVTFVIVLIILALLTVAIIMTVLYAKIRKSKLRVCESKECLRSAANLALSMDPNVDPCEDFYQYVCGNWAFDHPRPDAYRSYDWFRDKQTKVYTVVRDFLHRNTSNHPKPVTQAKDMYSACMDTETLDQRGLKPVTDLLRSVGLPLYPTFTNLTEDFDYSTYKFDWIETVIKVKTLLGMDILIGFDIFTDPKNSTIYRLVMGSPETTNPFPSLYNDKKHITNKKLPRTFILPTKDVIDNDETIFFNADNYFETNEAKAEDNDDVEDEKFSQIYKLFYAELIKSFAIEADAVKNSNLAETDIDLNILKAATEFYDFYETMYGLESDNDTDLSDDDLGLNLPQYTVAEVQSHTDEIVEKNNGTVVPIWKRYLNGVFSISDVDIDFNKDTILISDADMKYMALMATIVSKTPPVVIELYIWLKVVEVMAVHTTTELRVLFQKTREEARSHSSKYSTGSPPRSLLCANAVNDMMGMAVSYAIADPYFLNVTKPKIQTMLYELKNALAHLVGVTKWMDDDTKLATYQKIIEMKSLIGFPDWLLEEGKIEEYYQGLEIETDKHLENMISVIRLKMKKVLNRFREGNNFTWATDPTEVNAYHTFQENTITVPLVMLQYPFFDLGLDSLNYGSLGSVLGHEITHGFDNFGRQFDKNGNLLQWWSNKTIESFVNMTKCFVDQYSEFVVPELNQHVDGKKTLGENIADNGGLHEAMAALKRHLRKIGPEPKLPGFEHMTPEQLFFISYGNLWCGVSTPDSLRGELSDEHSPQQIRALGALRNTQRFSEVWRCPEGSYMNPETKCVIF